MRHIARFGIALALAGAGLAAPTWGARDVPQDVHYGFVTWNDEIGTRPAGWSLRPSADVDPQFLTGHFVSVPDADLSAYEGWFCRVEGVLDDDAVPSTDGNPRVQFGRVDGRAISVTPAAGYARPLLRALEDLDVTRPGLAEPPTGACLDDPDLRLPLHDDSVYDGFQVGAHVCRDDGRYWVHTTGGFAGVSWWHGPFELPEPDAVPDDLSGAGEANTERAFVAARIAPSSVRVRGRARSRRVTLGQSRDVAPFRPSDPITAGDVDFGDGVTVDRVLRQRGRRVRVLIRVAPDAVPGARSVTVRGAAAEQPFTLRPRRAR